MSVINMFLTLASPYAAILVIFIVGFKVLKNQDVLYKNTWNTGLLLLFIWSLLVGIINREPLSATAALGILLYFLLSVYLQNKYNDENKISNLLKKLVFFTLFSAFIGIAEKVTSLYSKTIWWGLPFGIPLKFASQQDYRIYSTFGNPNVAGTWFASMILISLYFNNVTSKFKSVLYAGAACLFTVMLFLTGSRGAALGLLLGLIVYGFFNRQRKIMVLITLIFLFVSITMFAYPYLLPSGATASYSTSVAHGVADSANGRELIWQSSINMFKLKPITGWGLIGTYFADSSIYLYHKKEFHSHNIWLTVVSSLGVVGLAVYVYMRYNLYKELKILWNSGCKLVPLLTAVQALVIGHGLVDFTAMAPHGGLIFFGASALVYGLAMQYSRTGNRDYYSLYLFFNRHKVRGSLESPWKI